MKCAKQFQKQEEIYEETPYEKLEDKLENPSNLKENGKWIDNIDHNNKVKFDFVPVQTLPTASADTMSKIYLVAKTGVAAGTYDEYITIREGTEGAYTYKWERPKVIAKSTNKYEYEEHFENLYSYGDTIIESNYKNTELLKKINKSILINKILSALLIIALIVFMLKK